ESNLLARAPGEPPTRCASRAGEFTGYRISWYHRRGIMHAAGRPDAVPPTRGEPMSTVTAASPRQAKLIGLACLIVTALGWARNWPAPRLLLQQCPPLTARGIAGLVAAAVLAGVAASRRESLAVPRLSRPRLVRAALLNVTAWMGLTTLSMLWLKAGEA